MNLQKKKDSDGCGTLWKVALFETSVGALAGQERRKVPSIVGQKKCSDCYRL